MYRVNVSTCNRIAWCGEFFSEVAQFLNIAGIAQFSGKFDAVGLV